MANIGIIGYGFVGKAVHNSLINHEVFYYDKFKESYPYSTIVKNTDIVFVCVPTPTEHKQQNTEILKEELTKLYENKFRGLVILKSTTIPKAYEWLSENIELNMMVAPEFLDQHNPFEEHDTHLIGVKNLNQAKVYTALFEEINPIITDPITALFIKYVHNCYGAAKVTFFNEMYDLCQQSNVDYRTMLNGLLEINPSINKLYTRISADGKRGFGGACFPKDVVAFNQAYQSHILKAIVNANRNWREDEMIKVL